MRIHYTTKEIAKICSGKLIGNGQHSVRQISFDTRRISNGKWHLFLCLASEHRNGHDFIARAYELGVRSFMIDQPVAIENFPDAHFIQVDQVIDALQKWATFHRSKFDIPVIGITGSAGKTVVKEQLFALLHKHMVVARNPKSYNSQLGVALSMFEITEQTEIALIEAGISMPGEMESLKRMIQPNLGIFTSFGQNHRHNFESESDHLAEKLSLFSECKHVWAPATLSHSITSANFTFVKPLTEDWLYQNLPSNLAIYQAILDHFELPSYSTKELYDQIPKVALRMETYDGMNHGTIIHDAFNWSLDGLEQALGYQMSLARGQERTFVYEQSEIPPEIDRKLKTELGKFGLIRTYLTDNGLVAWSTVKKLKSLYDTPTSILLKGNSPKIQRTALNLRARKHSTFVEINLGVLKRNIDYWKGRIPKSVKVLAMLKASSYGAELGQLASFIYQQGFDYIGVAYADEGVKMRQVGIQRPIMVMNCDEDSWNSCIEHQLEPAIFSLHQLKSLVAELDRQNILEFGIHLKVDTGMRRLGFDKNERHELFKYLRAQQELKIKSIYSHLADAGNPDRTFTNEQIEAFGEWKTALDTEFGEDHLAHILNSDGIAHHPDGAFGMVRLGIAMYGITSETEASKNIHPVISWKSKLSQVKRILKGETVGYNRSFEAPEDMTIAVVPVGYADGFKRMLGNGKGGVYVDNVYCPTVGNVCMDMIMIDLRKTPNAQAGQEVEIIGNNQSIDQLAQLCDTIPYEIMTSLSRRLPRIFIDEN